MIHKLEVDSVHLQFGDKNILSDIYLQCQTGKITGLLGRNGTGKSSLMNVIFGTLKCEKSVRIDNLPQNEVFKKSGLILYLPQFNFIPPSLSIKNVFKDYNLDYANFLKIFPEFSCRQKSLIKELSGGERRLIEVYIVVKYKSLFTMLDEPFTHLSPIQIGKIKKLLVHEKKNKGILISDHLYKHILDISNEFYVLSDAKLHKTHNFNDLEKVGYLL